ncbi:MAG: hypothetical protein A3H69_03120 [Candidatus Sungbacteria bacterium RIFCSPLOWO2_02_FULL_47_9]|uniref:Response regulatory domain-containing protein n=1 Tax=Candidatus Sungbacteria bacterium RIFCSPHIGHO2_01_FULL_47_32 TaxID=1802264 RepID=A0A1G2K381_9BACT|nr:MAG: Alkaline phosphatase synthesis transcriptional regulatory proteinphoP [Parcubacteria group bacterium GW2011_GWA2_47_10]OGZ93845.1 MAG: hypothetical protein A2633_04405 [Candidatus Sungbacteria bacterium RIFCSPHIGHO2_01_FULL_47_32]OHA04716.1 MAG: hypothetical protein A3A28_00885 [Candidatus Sungbacteria bacterium RIFCSPLOWO2_01_FULL_47_32]OHA09077.1 MAG: hypothetical protein A3H69_03120 [Candidatus Sungbacteria bacterium RIFCSPLOWO2_02_FULL_47_9]
MATQKRTKVLVVDDDQFISEMYILKLRESGFDAESAADGVAALEKIKKNEPAIVLLDIVLPNMDGFDILKKLADEKLLKKTSVVLLSNLGEKKDIEKGLALGAIDYIVKAHFTPSEVVERVEKILKKAEE